MNRLEIISAIKKFKSENAKTHGINTLGVFGSAARDEIGAESDVDIVRKRKNMNPFLKKRIERDVIYV